MNTLKCVRCGKAFIQYGVTRDVKRYCQDCKRIEDEEYTSSTQPPQTQLNPDAAWPFPVPTPEPDRVVGGGGSFDGGGASSDYGSSSCSGSDSSSSDSGGSCGSSD